MFRANFVLQMLHPLDGQNRQSPIASVQRTLDVHRRGFSGARVFFCFFVCLFFFWSGLDDGVRRMERRPTIGMSLSQKQMSMFCLR